MRRPRRSWIVEFMSLALLTLACDRTRPTPEGPTPPAEPRMSASAEPGDTSAKTPPSVAPLPADVWRGVCLAHNWQDEGARGYGTDASAEALDHLDELGVGWISLTPFGWMAGQTSSEIHGEHTDDIPDGGERLERMERVVEQARARSMKVMLKPHLWLRGGAWRGGIEPRGADGELAWAQWWDSYRAFLLYYAELAQRLELEALVVGVELVSAVRAHPEQLARTIAAVRRVYDGPLTYSANWDEELPDSLWRQLDAVGVQFYPPLSEEPDPGLATLRRALQDHLGRWASLGERIGRPVWLTEVGYKSSPTTAAEPFGWPEHLDPSERQVDEAIQARAWRALLLEVPEHPPIQAIFAWKYFTDRDTTEEAPWGFRLRGKRAEEVLGQAYASP